MSRWLLFMVLVVLSPQLTFAAIVEVPPDDYTIWADIARGARQQATAQHPAADVMLQVWTAGNAAGTDEVHAAVIDANIPVAGALFLPMETSTNPVRDPAVAFDTNAACWLVVWAEALHPGAYEIVGRYLKLDGSYGGPVFTISQTGIDDTDPAFDAIQPDVSSNEAGVFLVAWAADNDADGHADGDFAIYRREINALSATMGPVLQQTNFGPGGAALHPKLGWFYATQTWAMAWEGDPAVDATGYVPSIYGALVSGAARQSNTAVLLSGANAARRANSFAARNPAVAMDRFNQHLAIIWDITPGPAPVARRIEGVVLDAAFGQVTYYYGRDLDAEGQGPLAYVRDPNIGHSRISGQFVMAWRESLSPVSGSGQTILARDMDSLGNFGGPALVIANQGTAGVLPNEYAAPVVQPGWTSAGRVFVGWVSNSPDAVPYRTYGQGLDLAAAVAAPPDRPTQLTLSFSHNPFNPRTEVQLSLPEAGRVKVDIFDLRGRLVRHLVDEHMPVGDHARRWSGLDDSGRRVASGVYLVHMQHPRGERQSKVTLVE